MFTLGIDLGKNGGLCLMKDGEIIIKRDMPKHIVTEETDWFEIERLFAEMRTHIRFNPVKVFVEKIHSLPGNSAKSSTTFNRHIGRFENLTINWFKQEPTEITPRTWQKWIFKHANIEEIKNAKGKRATKEMALVAIHTLFKGQDFRRNERCKIPHDGIVDAVLIAYYADNIDKQTNNIKE